MIYKNVNGKKVQLSDDEERNIINERRKSLKEDERLVKKEEEKKKIKKMTLQKICETCNLSKEEIETLFQP